MKNNRNCDGHCDTHTFIACQNGLAHVCNCSHKAQAQGTMDPNKVPRKTTSKTDYDDFLNQLEKIQNQMDTEEIETLQIQTMTLEAELLQKRIRDKAGNRKTSKRLDSIDLFREVSRLFNAGKTQCTTARRLERFAAAGLFKGFNGELGERGFNASESPGFA